MALSAPRSTVERSGDTRQPPVAANTTVFQGGLTCVNAAGYAVPGAVATTLKAFGRAEETVTNGATAGAATVRISAGIFRWKNSSAGDAIALSDVGATCYIVDDETVAKTDGTGTRSAAGKIWDVDAMGVWVDMR